MDSLSKQTPLNAWHKDQDAHMAEFAGYQMPLWYPAGTKQEHLAVLLQAGLFDTSHMASIIISGPQAFDLLQQTFSRDLAAWNGRPGAMMPQGRCAYGVFLNPSGEVIDDALVYKVTGDTYMVVVNAGMGKTITAHLNTWSENKPVKIRDLTDRVGKMDIQGPLSARILSKILTDPETVLKDMVYFSFKGFLDSSVPVDPVRLKNGAAVMLSRSGYTGEFGFELFMDAEHLKAVWDQVLDAGRDLGIQACGLAARDSLRTGAVLPLSHQDIGPWPFVNHPWMFALPLNNRQDGFTKSFVGDTVLSIKEKAAHTYAYAGFDPRKIVTENANVMDDAGTRIGRVLTCTTDMAIGRTEDRICSITSPEQPADFRARGLSCGFVMVDLPLEVGTIVTLGDHRRKIKVRIETDIRPDRTARNAMKKML